MNTCVQHIPTLNTFFFKILIMKINEVWRAAMKIDYLSAQLIY